MRLEAQAFRGIDENSVFHVRKMKGWAGSGPPARYIHRISAFVARKADRLAAGQLLLRQTPHSEIEFSKGLSYRPFLTIPID